MNRAFLVTRPNHDLITTYLYHWTKLVITEAEKRNIKGLDLKGKKANSANFRSYINKHQPKLVFFNGHGAKNAICGYDDEVIIESGRDEVLLSGKIVYARSCDAADKLGQLSVKSGTTAFIGYRKKFTVGYTPSKITDPLHDKTAELFIIPSNLVPISLLKGNTVGDSYRKSQEAMMRNFIFMLSTAATAAQKDAAPYLWMNRKYQIALGNLDARL